VGSVGSGSGYLRFRAWSWFGCLFWVLCIHTRPEFRTGVCKRWLLGWGLGLSYVSMGLEVRVWKRFLKIIATGFLGEGGKCR
jgi:hypothetical protein